MLAAAFCLAMAFLARPLLARVSTAYDEAGQVPGGWVVAIFAGVLLSAFITEEIGIAVIFGAFIAGTIMPRHAGLTEDVTHRIEDFVVISAADVLRLHGPQDQCRPARPVRCSGGSPGC